MSKPTDEGPNPPPRKRKRTGRHAARTTDRLTTTDDGPNPAERDGAADPTDRLNTVEAGEYLRLSPHTLERYRVAGGGPQYLKLGRLVFYEKRALDDWLASRRRRSTSDPGPDDEERSTSDPGPDDEERSRKDRRSTSDPGPDDEKR